MPRRTHDQLWLKGPVADLLIGCGGWSLPLIGLTLYLTQQHYGALSLVFYFLALFCNNPHYMATLYRAYGVKRDLDRYKLFSIYITAIIVISGISAHLSPALLPILFTVYLVWSPWHYTGQNFGIAMMMLRRGRVQPSRAQRNALYISYIGSYLVWLVELDSEKNQDAMTLTIGLPDALALCLKLVGHLAFIIGCAYSFLSLSKRWDARTLYAPMLLHLSQFLWFLLPSLLRSYLDQAYPATYFSAGILAFMHCAQYLWVTSYYAKRETEQGLRGEKGAWHPWKYFSVLVLGGIALFVPGPWIVSMVFRHDLFESALIFMALVNIHHFMLDGAIWKLREGRIARLLLGAGSDRAASQARDENALPDLVSWLLGRSWIARATRYGGAAALLFFATIDQIQNAFTKKGSKQERVEIARSINASDSRVFFRSGLNLLSEGRRREGIEELEAALDLNPRNLAALHALAQQRMVGSELKEASALYSRILDIFPRDLSALNNAGLLAINDERWEDAYAFFRKAREIDPNRWETNCFLGQALTRLENWAEAIVYLEFCMASNVAELNEAERRQRLSMVVPYLAECYEKSDRRDEANALKALMEKL